MPMRRAQAASRCSDVDLLAQLLPVDGARAADRQPPRSSSSAEDLVEQVVFDLLALDEPLGELRVALQPARRAASRDAARSVSSVAAMACDDDASSLRRMSAVRCRWRCGSA